MKFIFVSKNKNGEIVEKSAILHDVIKNIKDDIFIKVDDSNELKIKEMTIWSFDKVIWFKLENDFEFEICSNGDIQQVNIK